MIHEIGVQLQAFLLSKKCPIPVIDGPERRTETTYARERVVIEEDEAAGDSFTAPLSQRTNPPRRWDQKSGVKITLHAQSPNKGAIYFEHKRRCRQLSDLVLCGLYTIAKGRANFLTIKSGRFVTPEDFKAAPETPGGATYELLLTFSRGVIEYDWLGAAGPTITISPQLVGGPSLTFDGTAHTITRSFGSWLADGFAAGSQVIVSSTASNNGTLGPITALTDTVMTFAAGLTNETATGAAVTGTGVVIHSSGQVAEGGESTEGT